MNQEGDKTVESDRPRILVLAYACDPYAGSEAGAGWAMVRIAARVGDVTALIAAEHMPSVDRWLAEHPEHRDVRFVPVEEAGNGSFVARMVNLDRRAGFIPYIRWLPGAGRVAQSLHAEEPFDASLHGGYGSYWLPTPLVDLEGVPCVWGPVGGGTRTPRGLWRYQGIKGLLGELQKSIVLAITKRLPTVRRTWEEAPIHLFEGPETMEALPVRYRNRAQVVNRVLLYDLPESVVGRTSDTGGEPEESSIVLFPSLLEPRKGPMLAVHALSHTPDNVRLVFVNDGYATPALRRAARRLGIEHRVEFRGRIPRPEMLALVRRSAAVVFAGLREEGGMALVEAMMSGAPVVVLAHGGPRVIVEHATDPSRVAAVRPGSAADTARRMGAAMTGFATNPPQSTSRNLDDTTKEEMARVLLRAAGRA